MDKKDTKDALTARERFIEYVQSKKPVTVILEKGKHAGKQMHIVTVKKGPYALEYWGIVGRKKIATMLTAAPIGGIAQVTNSVVAHSFWRCGIAHHVYSEINKDLSIVHAALEPNWNAMTPDAVRFWKELSVHSPEIQARLETVLAQMDSTGATAAHDEMKIDDIGQFWNGDSMSKKKLEGLGIDTTSQSR